jgi:hypothetical protein
VSILALIAATRHGSGTTGLQKAGSIAAIVGATVALLLLLAGIVRWWWRGHHRVRSVKVEVRPSGEEVYLVVTGLPAATATVTAFVDDGAQTKKLGPASYRRDISEEHLFNLREGHQHLDEAVGHYTVEVRVTSDHGDERRVFKKKIRTPPPAA